MPKNKILLGISGGIAVYKIATLVNLLKKNNYEVRIIMTEAATKFVSPLTFETLSNYTVAVSLFDENRKVFVEHVSLADWCDLMLIAPATANTISKISLGLADNLLTSTVLALPLKVPVIIVPAMNVHMWENEIVQDNIKRLKKIKVDRKNKYNFIEPRNKILACGYEGKGVIAENEIILKNIKKIIK